MASADDNELPPRRHMPLAEDALPRPPLPEKALWRAVLVRALLDLSGDDQARAREARQWFLSSGTPDEFQTFAWTCELLGLVKAKLLREFALSRRAEHSRKVRRLLVQAKGKTVKYRRCKCERPSN